MREREFERERERERQRERCFKFTSLKTISPEFLQKEHLSTRKVCRFVQYYKFTMKGWAAWASAFVAMK